MENALIVSHSEKGCNFFNEMLISASCNKIITTKTGAGARRIFIEHSFDLCIINAPLSDESGEALAKYIADKGISQVLLIVKSEFYDEISSMVEDYGVITVSKPINKNLFWTSLKLAIAAQNKLKKMQLENSKLVQKIEDIRIVDRAKCILISYLKMNEEEAHKYIEKQAMDMRMTRREIAEGILKTYEN